MRATPPSRRMSAGTRSSAMTGDSPGVLGDLRLLGVDDVHDDPAAQHVGEPALDERRAGDGGLVEELMTPSLLAVLLPLFESARPQFDVVEVDEVALRDDRSTDRRRPSATRSYVAQNERTSRRRVAGARTCAARRRVRAGSGCSRPRPRRRDRPGPRPASARRASSPTVITRGEALALEQSEALAREAVGDDALEFDELEVAHHRGR